MITFCDELLENGTKKNRNKHTEKMLLYILGIKSNTLNILRILLKTFSCM